MMAYLVAAEPQLQMLPGFQDKLQTPNDEKVIA